MTAILLVIQRIFNLHQYVKRVLTFIVTRGVLSVWNHFICYHDTCHMHLSAIGGVHNMTLNTFSNETFDSLISCFLLVTFCWIRHFTHCLNCHDPVTRPTAESQVDASGPFLTPTLKRRTLYVNIPILAS